MFHSCHCCTPNPSSDTNIGLHEQIVLGQLKLWYFALSPDLANRPARPCDLWGMARAIGSVLWFGERGGGAAAR